jgi:hypothetical protein
MNEKGPKKVNPLDAVSVTNWALKKLGKGLGAAAKAGYEKYSSVRDDQVERQSVEEIHGIMYPGTRPMPGHPLPPMRTTSLSPDELARFTSAAQRLVDRGIALPPNVTNFASRFYIRLRR